MSNKRILCVGLVCVDLIQVCEKFPDEDSDQRSIDHRWQRGGNASNNCTVLAKCGEDCEFFGTMADDFMAEYAKKDFKDNNIICENIIFHSKCKSPFSSVIINAVNGSRTIIHSNNDLPELNLGNFSKLNLENYRWIHFEGRNIDEILLMIDRILQWNLSHSPIKISIEFEKPKKGLLKLLPLADVVFIGKDFAKFQGCHSKYEALEKNILLVKPRSIVIVAWGEYGAVGQTTHGERFECPAFLTERVVDTLGAGDTFVAATILFLSKEHSLGESITAGCRIAGAKVTDQGFSAIHPGLLK